MPAAKIIEPTLLVLHRGAFQWEVETAEPQEARDQVLLLFGTTRLATPFASSVNFSAVVTRLATLNPKAAITLAPAKEA